MGMGWLYVKKNRLRRAGTHILRAIRRRHPKIIVSMTSYPARIDTVHLAIRSLLAQKTLPDKIVLWLCKADFPNREADFPQSLLDVLWHDVEVRWVDTDLKPHKKYFWALQEFSEDYVITTDDDLLYRNTMISDLLAAHAEHPDAIAAVRTHLIMFNEDGTRTPYEQWIYEAPHYYPKLIGVPSMRIFATNGAGTLYPPHLMPAATFDVQEIEKTCLTADDLWLKVMQVKAGMPVVAATGDQLLNYIPGTQGEEALCHRNTESGVNNIVLATILDELEQKNMLSKTFDELVADPALDTLLD